tara:strand:+ start:653 stop:1138 length:486 start_codon:yes stop_codon:yes gene_type:complete
MSTTPSRRLEDDDDDDDDDDFGGFVSSFSSSRFASSSTPVSLSSLSPPPPPSSDDEEEEDDDDDEETVVVVVVIERPKTTFSLSHQSLHRLFVTNKDTIAEHSSPKGERVDGAKSFEGRRSLDKAKKGGSRRRIKDIITARVSTKAEEEGGRAFSGGMWVV